MNNLLEKYMVSDTEIIRDLKKSAAQGNNACTDLLLTQTALSLKLVLVSAASSIIKKKAEDMLATVEGIKKNN